MDERRVSLVGRVVTASSWEAREGSQLVPSVRPGEEQAPGALRSEPGTLLEHVSVAVFGIGADDEICFWGPGAQDLFGYDAATALTRPAALLFPAGPDEVVGVVSDGDGGREAGRRTAALLAERGRTGYWRGRLPVRHRDGTVFSCGFRVFPVAGSSGRSVVLGLSSPSAELDRVKDNLAFLDALFETCPIGLVMLDEQFRYIHLNQALAEMDGLSIEEHIGRRMGEVMITSDDGEYERMLHAVAAERRPVLGALVALRTPAFPDRDQVRSVSFFPLSGAVGTRSGLGGLMTDVTDRERAIREASASRRRLGLLDRAAARIGTTLDLDVTAQELVDVAVPEFADAAVVEIVEWMDESLPFLPEWPLTTCRLASGTVLPPPATEAVGGLDCVTYPPGSAIHAMMSTGRPLCVPVNDEFMARTVVHEQRARLLRQSGLEHILIAPLVARGAVQGLAMFGRSAARPAFTDDDLSLSAELASRAAICLDNARLYGQVQEIALTLQRALLPSALAVSPHVEVAHRYVPGSRITEVGGDWYDVIGLPGGRVALVVGDVMGHGVPAAAAMGRLHISARALARHKQEPDQLLAELDICAQDAGIELATCLYIVYDPATGRARIANAGHPPPLVLHPDGTVDAVGEVLGVPLGVGGHPFATTEIELPDRAVIALYTDGLVEARGRDIEDGLAMVSAELRGASGLLEDTVERILARLLPEPPRDDTVLVLARVRRI
ncbi:SpoIIE family protein phosphatase [Streptomyces sp. NPDC127084]|uniref:SpoIIE family protein phosphatase n=1 Tax=Streptomyces sp. NPDC127084 TaxID=3347133 RepID=UPI003658DDB6